MFLWQLISSVSGKIFENWSKIQLESTMFENQNRMLILHFHFLKFLLKIQICEEIVKDKSSGDYPKQTNYVVCFFCYLESLSNVLTKTAKISQYSQCLHYSFTQLWDAIFNFFEVLVLANKMTIWWHF